MSVFVDIFMQRVVLGKEYSATLSIFDVGGARHVRVALMVVV